MNPAFIIINELEHAELWMFFFYNFMGVNDAIYPDFYTFFWTNVDKDTDELNW